jgi:hypothetical protein
MLPMRASVATRPHLLEWIKVATWAQFSEEAPNMAALGQRILRNYGIAYLGTVRPDGGPRVHPVSPVVVGDHMYLGMMPDTPKRRDLDRDPRCVVHTLPGPMDSEVCISARARRISDDEVDKLIATAPAHVRIARDTIMYKLDIERVTCTEFEADESYHRPKPTRTVWRARQLA